MLIFKDFGNMFWESFGIILLKQKIYLAADTKTDTENQQLSGVIPLYLLKFYNCFSMFRISFNVHLMSTTIKLK